MYLDQQDFYQIVIPLVERGATRQQVTKAVRDALVASRGASRRGPSTEVAAHRQALALMKQYGFAGQRPLQQASIPPELGTDAADVANFLSRHAANMSEEELAEYKQNAGLTDEQVEDALLASQMRQAEIDRPVPDAPDPLIGGQREGDLFPMEPEEVEYERGLERERYERAVQRRQADIAEEQGQLAGEMLEQRQAREYEQAPKALRRREIIRLIREGGEGFRSEDPVVQDMAREFADLRRNELKSAVFGTLRNIGAAAGEQLTGRAIKRGPLTPQPDPTDTTAADRKAAQQLLLASERNIPKLFAVDAANVREARSFMIDMIDQVRQRGDAREKNSLDASIARLTARTDIASQHVQVGLKLVEALEGDFAKVRSPDELRNDVWKAMQGTKNIFGQRQNVTFEQVLRKVANNRDEVDNTVQAVEAVLDSSPELRAIMLAEVDSVEQLVKDNAKVIARTEADLQPSSTYAAMSGTEIKNEVRRRIASDMELADESDEARIQSDIELQAMDELMADPGIETKVIDMISNEGMGDLLNDVITTHARAGFAEQALGPLAQEYATMLGYADPKSMMDAVMGQALPASERAAALEETKERRGRLEEKAFARPNPFRTRQFKQQLLLPENQQRLAALDRFAKSMNLNRDDALKALAMQYSRDQKKSRETTPNVLAQIAQGQTAAEIKAQKSLKVMGEPGYKPDVDVIRKPTPAPPAAEEDTEAKGDAAPEATE